MSKMVKKSYKEGRRGKKTPTTAVSMTAHVLARRLDKQIKEEVKKTGEITDLIMTAHALVRTILT